MFREYNGELVSKEHKRYGIVISRFNDFITEKLLAGALDALNRSNANKDNVEILRVPGAFEIPLTAKKMAASKKYDAIICLGCIIRGETPHFEYVASEVSKGIALTSLEFSMPISFGIITADNTDQAIERAGNKSGNKGFEATKSAIEMINLFDNAGI